MLPLLVFLAAVASAAAAEPAFSRITRGWTDYSTAFNTTHELSADGEFATVASFFTPPYTARPLEFATIVIWSELPPKTIDFSDFNFSLCIWSGLDHFIANPRRGDVQHQDVEQPSTILRDGITRGGRPTYELRFALTNSTPLLRNCHTYLIGVIAHADPTRSGELYVPTAPTEGASDVQAGNIVPFGWQYLIDAGGLTVHSGQAATELVVERLGDAPTIALTLSNQVLHLSWAAWASCYSLEAADALTGPWRTSTNVMSVESNSMFFRLRGPP